MNKETNMNEKRNAYVLKLKDKIDEWNAEIEKLAAKAGQTDTEANIKYHTKLEDLRVRLKDVEKKIVELQQTSDGGWGNLKAGLENSWETLKTSFSEAKSEFKRGYREGREEE